MDCGKCAACNLLLRARLARLVLHRPKHSRRARAIGRLQWTHAGRDGSGNQQAAAILRPKHTYQLRCWGVWQAAHGSQAAALANQPRPTGRSGTVGTTAQPPAALSLGRPRTSKYSQMAALSNIALPVLGSSMYGTCKRQSRREQQRGACNARAHVWWRRPMAAGRLEQLLHAASRHYLPALGGIGLQQQHSQPGKR